MNKGIFAVVVIWTGLTLFASYHVLQAVNKMMNSIEVNADRFNDENSDFSQSAPF